MKKEKTREARFDEKRRNFLKSGALLGGTVLFSSMLRIDNAGVHATLASNSNSPSDIFENDYETYQLAHPENIIYSACLMCHNDCGIKVKLQYDKTNEQFATPVKIDGNPYIPTNLLPWLPMETPPAQASLWDGKLCPKGQAGVQAYADPYRVVKVLKRAGLRLQ